MVTMEERVSRLEGIADQTNIRLGNLESGLTTLTTITIAMWVTTMLAVLSVLAAVLLRIRFLDPAL